MLYINVGADALIGPMAGLFGEQALRYGLTEYVFLRSTYQKAWRSYPEASNAALGDHIIGALFEEDTQVRDISSDQVLDPKVGVRFQGPGPVNEFPGSGPFLDALNIS